MTSRRWKHLSRFPSERFRLTITYQRRWKPRWAQCLVWIGSSGRSGEDRLLNPECDSARLRAFFVHPEWARRGIGRGILAACESAIQAAGFHSAELVATLGGEPFYAAFDYSPAERYEVSMSAELTLPVVHMRKHFGVV